jgi:O-methyltransferase involved in polyketide biosynthesis
MLLTLFARVEEYHRSDRLFRDDKAVEWAYQISWESRWLNHYNWKLQTLVAVRTHLFDQLTQQHLTDYPDGVVVELGSGLSTRYHRLQPAGAKWLGVDLPAVNQIRRQLDVETRQYQFVSSFVTDFDWMHRIPTVPSQKILFIAEGLLMYLNPQEVQKLFARLRQRFPGASLIGDVVGEMYRQHSKEQQKQKGVAPFQWFYRGWADLERMGLTVEQQWSTLSLCRERWGWLRYIAWIPGIKEADLFVSGRLS